MYFKLLVTAVMSIMAGTCAHGQVLWAPSPGGFPVSISSTGDTLGLANFSVTDPARYLRMTEAGPQVYTLAVNGEVRRIHDDEASFLIDRRLPGPDEVYDCSPTACRLRSLQVPGGYSVSRVLTASRDLQVVLGAVATSSGGRHFYADADGIVHLSPYGSTPHNALITNDGALAYLVVLVNNAYFLARWRFDGVSEPELLMDEVWLSDHIMSADPDNGLLMWRHAQLVRWTEDNGERVIAGCCPTTPSTATADGEMVLGPTPNSVGPAWMWTPVRGVRQLQDVVPQLRTLGATRIYSLRVAPNGRRLFAAYEMGSPPSHALIADLPLDPCPVDFNRDGVEDSADIALVIDLIAGAPNPLELPLDVNRDGSADQGDVAAVVSVIAGAGCP